ncbi:MAG: hypothetical protein CMJ83_09825 [Planctomycetes bacterium]|nr:hypothetical protein [Planctomycetota bacterium]
MRFPLRLLIAHLMKNWFRSLLTLISVFVAIAIFGFLRMFIVGMETSLEAAASNKLVTQSAISLFSHLPMRLGQDIADHQEVESSCHWTWFGGIYIDTSPDHIWGRFGCDPDEFRAVYGDEIDLPEEAWQEWRTTKTTCIVGKNVANREKFKVGQTITLEGDLFLGNLDLEIVGIYKSRTRAFDEDTLFMHWDYMNEVSKQNGGRHDRVSTWTILLDDEKNGPTLSARIDAANEASDHRTRTLNMRAFQSQFTSMWGNLPLFFTIIGTIVLVACLMVTANTMFLNARDRVREVGILKTLGFGPKRVMMFTLVESMILCVVGGALGVLAVAPMDGRSMMFVIAAVPPSTFVEGIAIAGLLGLLSGIAPAMMAMRLSIVEAVRKRA